MNDKPIDELVAEKVMGWIKPPETSILKSMWVETPIGAVHPQLPKFSTNIEAAWLVVGALQEKNNWNFELKRRKDGKCFATFIQLHSIHDNTQKEPNEWWDKANTAPMAICIAALKAVGEEWQ